MSAVKLETFALPANGTPSLEQFRSDLLERERNEAYANGFKDGVNVTKDAVNAEQTRLLAVISECLSDAQISRQEVHASVIRSLQPMMDALISHLAPKLVDSGFTAAIVSAVSRANEAEFGGELRLRVNGAQVEMVTAALSDCSTQPQIIADPALGAFEAQLDWADGFDTIDLRRFLSEIDAALAEFHELNEEDRHERSRDAG